MTFRTFTLKDFFDRDAAMAKMQAEQRRPLASGDLAGAGLSFVPLPEVGGPALGEGERVVLPEGSQTEEQLRLAKDWLDRPSSGPSARRPGETTRGSGRGVSNASTDQDSP